MNKARKYTSKNHQTKMEKEAYKSRKNKNGAH